MLLNVKAGLEGSKIDLVHTGCRSSRLFVSCLYCAAFVGLGSILASLGPSLLALEIQVNSESFHTMAVIFTMRSVGYLAGACLGGYALDHAPEKGHVLMTTALLCTAATTAAIPFVTSAGHLGVLMSIQGVALGILDTAGNTLLLFLYDGISSGPWWMQVLHCSFGLGAFVCPLMVEAAMSRSRSGFDYAPAFYFFAAWLSATALILCGISPSLPDRVLGGEKYDRAEFDEDVEVKYDRVDSDEHVKGLDTGEVRPKSPLRFKKVHVVAITALVLGLYSGVETGFGGYLLYFSQKQCGFSQSDGQYVTSVYWGCLAFGRCIAIPLSQIFTPKRHLAFDMVLSMLSAILLLGGHCRVMWYGSGLLGLGLASVFPTVVSLVESFIDVTGKSSSMLVVGSALGEMLIPLGMGLWTAAWHPGFLVSSALTIILCAGASAAVVFVGETMPKSQRGQRLAGTRENREAVVDLMSEEGLELRTLEFDDDFSHPLTYAQKKKLEEYGQ
jgi:FHS family Na+ dependent glucose MFS transporter 1